MLAANVIYSSKRLLLVESRKHHCAFGNQYHAKQPVCRGITVLNPMTVSCFRQQEPFRTYRSRGRQHHGVALVVLDGDHARTAEVAAVVAMVPGTSSRVMTFFQRSYWTCQSVPDFEAFRLKKACLSGSEVKEVGTVFEILAADVHTKLLRCLVGSVKPTAHACRIPKRTKTKVLTSR